MQHTNKIYSTKISEKMGWFCKYKMCQTNLQQFPQEKCFLIILAVDYYVYVSDEALPHHHYKHIVEVRS